MKSIPESQKFIIADQESYPADFQCPNPKGWYHSVANIASTPDGLVAVYRLSDSHCAVTTHIMVAYSADGGRTWTGHRSVSNRNVWEDHAVWAAPQMRRLRDGRLVIICDLGQRTSHDNWPMLAHWQKPDRGMWNFLFWSNDHGRTWSDPVRCDDVGGEPGYIIDLADGTLLYTATVSEASTEIIDGPAPWGNIYYRSIVMASEDGGNTWSKRSDLTNAPFQGDSEVGLVELEPNHVIAATRIGFGGGQFGQPSRLVHSHDGGRTWGEPILMPAYMQRAHLNRLQSGKFFITYRNRWGSLASYGFAFDPGEELGFEPSSQIHDEERCRLEDGVMILDTDIVRRAGLATEGAAPPIGDNERDNAVLFSLYPVIDHRSSVELELELRIRPGSGDGSIVIYAGFRVDLTGNKIRIPDRHSSEFSVDATGQRDETGVELEGGKDLAVELDATRWHRYRFVRRDRLIEVFVDGESILRADTEGRKERLVRFGSRGRLISEWRSGSARIRNPQDTDIDWDWNVENGFIDQFRRDRMVRLDHTSDSGYTQWTQTDDGMVVIADYTNDSFDNASWQHAGQPILKAYLARESDLFSGDLAHCTRHFGKT
ncbi:MAG: hypothetical protein DRP71_11795 [Verrucomicrobia bacterium]|nr:MAG: hypothetical protein DRP71_11795 [Verrucomicrobiota bacterium]